MKHRRWLGGLILFLAAAMLVCGETVLKSKLTEVGFLVYWLICLTVTGLAIAAALWDLRAQRRAARAAERELLQSTLQQIQAETRARPRYPTGPAPAKDHEPET